MSEQDSNRGAGKAGGADDPAATDKVWRRQEIESPCIKTCVLHPEERICIGCYRTGEEIATWSKLSPEARRDLMAELPSRAARLTTRRGGRAARRRG
ncbi:MAG: DUF1289 domain-containing protein [Pseudomonadota bacterium]